MNKFKEKREGLNLFVRENLIGPGAFNKRFFLLKRWDDSEFKGKFLKDVQAINNITEVLAEVPAYQYGSAILFPETKMNDDSSSVTQQEQEDISDFDEDAIEEPEAPDDENMQDHQSESVSSKNQNYPNTFGLAFAVNSNTDLQKDISIELRYRTYSKLSQKTCLEELLALWIPENMNEIDELINKYFSSVFKTSILDNNLFVYINPEVSIMDFVYEIDYSYLNSLFIDYLLPMIHTTFEKKGINIVSQSNDKVTYGFIETKEIYLYSVTKENKRGEQIFKNSHTLFADSISAYIQNELNADSENFGAYEKLIKGIEVFQQIKEIVTNLKSVHKKNKPTPIWVSQQHQVIIPLNVTLDKNILRNKQLIPTTGIGSIFLNYQLVKQTKDGNENVYIKLIVVNGNTIKLKENEPPQLNKKNKANEISLFGIELIVRETKSSSMVPYNPPNLLDFDEEDNFNKVLYRQYKDFGEGHNTSVDWGKSNDFQYITTEFLPEQETPRIGYKPSKFVGGKVTDRIDESVLSMKRLSTLSSLSDEEILEELKSFIDSYGIWIDEKQIDLDCDSEVSEKERELLTKQLNGCRKDFQRLLRSLELLNKDKAAMTAFRVMNTSMFMQLYHGIKVKEINKDNPVPFIPDVNNESFYRLLSEEHDYKWRSFQLAFVLLNIDGFVKPVLNEAIAKDVFETGWPERNELADLVWFPTGGGKTEAYLGIIAFCIAYRRFTKGVKSTGTTVIMRYTLRLLTLQQFQRATLLICALETIRKNKFLIPNNFKLGEKDRITIGLFVGEGTLPNKWDSNNSQNAKGIKQLFYDVQLKINNNEKVATVLPHDNCPWCGGKLFINSDFPNLHPNPLKDSFGTKDHSSFNINCNSIGCSFYEEFGNHENSLPFRLFDEDIYLNPPTLLFGTVDKFAAFANKVATQTGSKKEDSRRLLGVRHDHNVLPPELIIQDELHLLLGPLGSAVGLYEKGLDELCIYEENGIKIRPKIITSTATTRNTDKQIFALFNRRAEIFPKQGITCDDSFFSYYERKEGQYDSWRKYVGVLPVGKTQVWTQLRIASLCLVHRLIYLKQQFSLEELIRSNVNNSKNVLNYYHTVLSYFNSIKEVGKTQSQLSHYLPGDVNLITKNTSPWSFLDNLLRKNREINYSELTGRLTSEEIKTNLSLIERNWSLTSREKNNTGKNSNPPEYVISTNMISVGIDVARFNIMIINTMPRNIAEYIQASSRVARSEHGVVFTVHHPFRSRDLSHYQRFKEFHEKFYSYVEPISVTPFANKALESYLALYLAFIVRHNRNWGLENNDSASSITHELKDQIIAHVKREMTMIHANAVKLNAYLSVRNDRMNSTIEGIIDSEELENVILKLEDLIVERWLNRIDDPENPVQKYSEMNVDKNVLFEPNVGSTNHSLWKVGQSLRKIAPESVIKTVQQ